MKITLAARLLCELGPASDIEKANELLLKATNIAEEESADGPMMTVKFPDGSSCSLPRHYFGE